MNNTIKSIDADLEKAVDIVAAYVSHNPLRATDLPDLVVAVHSSLRQLGQGQPLAPVPEPNPPAVPIKKAIKRDYIVCLEDGKKFKSLRRHLQASHDLKPDQYRAKWGLPSDYPMVAPAYSEARSQMAKDSGLGRLVKVEGEKGEMKAVKAATVAVNKRRRGRPKKLA